MSHLQSTKIKKIYIQLFVFNEENSLKKNKNIISTMNGKFCVKCFNFKESQSFVYNRKMFESQCEEMYCNTILLGLYCSTPE